MESFAKKRSCSNLRKWANALTITRAVAGLPLVLALILNQFSLAWIILLIAGITDIADGWLARRSGESSQWGAKLDPLSDKLLLAAPFLWLVSNGVIPVWAAWLLMARELLVTVWRSTAKAGGPASKGGKAKTILQFISMLLLLWPSIWGGVMLSDALQGLGLWLFWISLLLAISSGVSYFKLQLN